MVGEQGVPHNEAILLPMGIGLEFIELSFKGRGIIIMRLGRTAQRALHVVWVVEEWGCMGRSEAIRITDGVTYKGIPKSIASPGIE